MVWIDYMAYPDCPQQSRTPIPTSTDTFMMLDHVDALFGNFHFLNDCVPNQKAITDEKMMALSSSQRICIATSKGTPVFHA